MKDRMLCDMITTLTGAGLRIEFRGFADSDNVMALIITEEIEHPHGAASHADPSVALALAASRGLGICIYNRVRAGFISLEEEHDTTTD